MPKVTAVPRHYTVSLNPDEMRHLVLGWRTYCAEFEVGEVEEDILAELEDKYEGELGQPPGDPLTEAA